MNAPLDTDNSMSTEPADPRRHVCDIQQTLADIEPRHSPIHLSAHTATHIGTWEWDGRTNRVMCSPETEQIFGLSTGSFDGTYEGFFALIHPHDRQRLSAAIANAVKERTFYGIEHRIITQDNSIRWVACSGRALFKDNEPVSGVTGTMEDITIRKQLELTQQHIRSAVEGLVRERTTCLEDAVLELKKEVERRQQAESALMASEQRYQALYEQNPFMSFTLTTEGIIQSVNSFGANQLGYDKDALTGQSILRVCDPQDHPTVLEQLQACSASPYKLFQWELQTIRNDGTRLWVTERAKAIHDNTGHIVVLVVCEDITERKRTEDQLHHTTHLVQTLVQESALPIISLDTNARVTGWNQAATRLFGLSEEEVLGHQLPYVQPGKEGMADAFWEAEIRGDVISPIELRRIRKDGTLLDLLLWPAFAFNYFGKLFVAVGLYVDQSDLKRAKEAKIKSEARLRSFLDALDDLAFEFDENGRYLNVWTQSEDKLPLPKQDLVGRPLTDIFGPEVGARYLKTIRHVIATGETAHVEYTMTPDDELRHFSGILTLIPGCGDDRATVGCIVRDITESRLANEQVRESEALWRTLYEHAGVGIAQLGLEGQFLRVNPRLCEMLGYSSETMLSRRFQDFTHPDDVSANLAYLQELLTGKRHSFSMEKRYRRSDNAWAWVDWTVSVVRATSDIPAYFIAVIRHIDDRKQAENQSRESEQAIRSLHEATSNPGLTFDQRIQTVLELGCHRFKLPIGIVTGMRNGQWEPTHVWAPGTAFTPDMYLPLHQTYCTETVKSKNVVCCEHVGASEWSSHPGYTNLHLECYIGTVLADEGNTLGTICFMGPDPHPTPFSQADKDFLQLMARWISGELRRKDSEQALKEQEALLRSVIETARDAIFMKDCDGRYQFINSAGALVIGKPPADIIGKKDDEIFPRETARRLMADDQSVFSGSDQRKFETAIPLSGEFRTFYSVKTPHRDQTGRIIGLVGVSRDMTDVRRAEQTLHLTQIAVDRSADLVFWIDRSAQFVYINDAACQRLGYPREELLRMTVADIDPEYQGAKWLAHWQELRRSGRLRFESRHRTKSGATYPVEIVANFVAVDGREYNVAFARDISDRKRSYSLLQAAINSVADGLLVIDRQGKVTSVNQRFLHLWNIPQALADSRDDEALFSFVVDQLQAPEAFVRKVRELYAHPDQESFDVLECKDGRVFERYARPQILDDEVVGRVWSFRDITEHRRAAEALRASELRLQRFVAEAPVGLCILDENWRTISANKALCELTGYDEHEILGSSYALYTHPEDLAAHIALTDEFFRGVRPEYTYEKRYIRKSGEIIWVSLRATRVELSGHAGPLLLAAVQDITERKLAMEEREHLSRDLHDNILQALYAVGMQLEAGKLSMGKSPRRSKIHMTHAVDQLNTLMFDVRRFIALLTQRTTAELDFGQALRQLIASMSGAGQSTPALDITNPVLSFITPKLGEQLLNIVREALSNSIRHAQASHRWVRLGLVDNAIHLVIGDDGVGFSIKRKRRAGHGLGNMAARAKQISATFTLKSAPGKGTSVSVGVPLKKGHVYE